jgi:hypothetical protein
MTPVTPAGTVSSPQSPMASTTTASTRWPSTVRPAGVGAASTTTNPTSGISQRNPGGGRRTRQRYS